MSGKLIDLSGNIYGDLTVIKRDGDLRYGIPLWLCLCLHGEYVYKTRVQLTHKKGGDCGCESCKKHRTSRPAANRVDRIGYTIGNLVVIERVDYRDGETRWRLRCMCGNEIVIRDDALKVRVVGDCGCVRKSKKVTCLTVRKSRKKPIPTVHKRKTPIDLTGRKFGKLTVKSFFGRNKFGYALWNCVCDCSHEMIASSANLKNGGVLSCGCLRSSGENAIESILLSQNIQFTREKKFIGCINKKSLRFDFFLPDYGICMEYDGPQHYIQFGKWGNNKLENTQKHDAIKTAYCEENDIILLRIPYTEKNNITEILIEWGIIHAADSTTQTAA